MNMNYIERLIENCKRAQLAVPVREFVMKSLTDLSGIKQAIYVIEQVDDDYEKTYRDFKHYKASKERSCAKLNSPSQVLYVGSSTTNLNKRISEHIGYGSKSTYALNLSHWFGGEYKITIKVFNENPSVLQILEDALSDELKPAFGKRGGNNK